MADLDLEALEELMKQEEKAKMAQHNGDQRDEGDRHKRRSSRSRSRSRKKKSHKHRSSRDRERDRSHKKHKKRRSSRSKSSRDSQRKLKTPVEEEIIDPIKKQEELLKKQIEEAKKQAEEAQRDDCTVLVNRLPLNANEKDLYVFFAKDKGVGKIRDVRLIRDQRSGKSKGIAYIEFYTPESVLLAMALSGTQMMGQTIMIQASQAEKNRAAAASKFKKEQDKGGNQPNIKDQKKKPEEGTQIYVGGLVDALNQVNESDIRQWFIPFGDIENIELPKDPNTGRNKGHAIIEFRKHKYAKAAVKEMNGFDINGKKLKVSIVTEQLNRVGGQQSRDYDLEEDSANQYIHSAQSRALLMQKLSREAGNTDQGQSIMSHNFNNIPQVPQYIQAMPTNCLLLNNLFDPDLVDLKKDPAFFIDIKEQVQDVCSELGNVQKVWVEQNSPGNVWIKFSKDDIQGAQKAFMTLNQRFFDQRLITANYVPENVFNSKVKER